MESRTSKAEQGKPSDDSKIEGDQSPALSTKSDNSQGLSPVKGVEDNKDPKQEVEVFCICQFPKLIVSECIVKTMLNAAEKKCIN